MTTSPSAISRAVDHIIAWDEKDIGSLVSGLFDMSRSNVIVEGKESIVHSNLGPLEGRYGGEHWVVGYGILEDFEISLE